MFTPKPRIELHVEDAERSAAFYAALLQTQADRSQGAAAVFDLESPPLTLTQAHAPDQGRPFAGALARFALVVPKPEDIGYTAIALTTSQDSPAPRGRRHRHPGPRRQRLASPVRAAPAREPAVLTRWPEGA